MLTQSIIKESATDDYVDITFANFKFEFSVNSFATVQLFLYLRIDHFRLFCCQNIDASSY